MKISELNPDTAGFEDFFVVLSGGETKRLSLQGVMDFLGTQESLANAVFEHPVFRQRLISTITTLLTDAGLDVQVGQMLAGVGDFVANEAYVVPGQSVPTVESTVAVGGVVVIEDEEG